MAGNSASPAMSHRGNCRTTPKLTMRVAIDKRLGGWAANDAEYDHQTKHYGRLFEHHLGYALHPCVHQAAGEWQQAQHHDDRRRDHQHPRSKSIAGQTSRPAMPPQARARDRAGSGRDRTRVPPRLRKSPTRPIPSAHKAQRAGAIDGVAAKCHERRNEQIVQLQQGLHQA